MEETTHKMVAEQCQTARGDMVTPEKTTVVKRKEKGKVSNEDGNVPAEDDPLLLSRRGSRLAICVTSAADLTDLFERLERVQLDDIIQSGSSNLASEISHNSIKDVFPNKSTEFSPNKSILKSSRERSRRKSVKFYFADEQTTV